MSVLLICFTTLNGADLTEDMYRHSLQPEHPFYAELDRIFASSKTLDTEKGLIKAGFTIIQVRDPLFIIAKHPSLPGHLVKVHLHSSPRSIASRWKNIITRCNAAERLRNLIKKEKIRYFSVPDKWIYTTPTEDQDPVLIVTYMNIVSEKQTKYAWKHLAKPKHLKELYCIISHGCGSSKLVENVPYTKEGIFTCIDTEKPTQGNRYIKECLSAEMKSYWDDLVRENKK